MSIKYELNYSRCTALCCKVDMAYVGQSRPDSGLGFQVKVLQQFQVEASRCFFSSLLLLNLELSDTKVMLAQQRSHSCTISSQKGVSNVVSLESIHPQTFRIDFITSNTKESVDRFVCELTLEE